MNTSIAYLQKLLQHTSNEGEKAKILKELARKTLNNNPQDSVSYSKKRLLLAQKNNNWKEELNSHTALATAYIWDTDYTNALKTTFNLLDVAKKHQATATIMIAYGMLAKIYGEVENYDLAYQNLRKAKATYQGMDINMKQAHTSQFFSMLTSEGVMNLARNYMKRQICVLKRR